MPIYEYYCPICEGRFRHLARRIDAPPPPCPRCGNAGVERLVGAANVVRSEGHHEQQLRQAATQVDADDPRAIARFLQESGRLADSDFSWADKAAHVCPVGVILRKREGFAVPIGKRRYDVEPIGMQVERLATRSAGEAYEDCGEG